MQGFIYFWQKNGNMKYNSFPFSILAKINFGILFLIFVLIISSINFSVNNVIYFKTYTLLLIPPIIVIFTSIIHYNFSRRFRKNNPNLSEEKIKNTKHVNMFFVIIFVSLSVISLSLLFKNTLYPDIYEIATIKTEELIHENEYYAEKYSNRGNIEKSKICSKTAYSYKNLLYAINNRYEYNEYDTDFDLTYIYVIIFISILLLLNAIFSFNLHYFFYRE